MVRYIKYTLTIETVPGGQILRKFENIRILQTYTQFPKGFVTYKKSAGSRTFPGFGKLRIGYGIAQYTQTDINPIVSYILYSWSMKFDNKHKFIIHAQLSLHVINRVHGLTHLILINT